ncbi:MAG: radical SAM family heme chaperone HemW [Clostridia bacterium]|nr:radical SAM family heme chaperone HemW [Clostridia bacterium]
MKKIGLYIHIPFCASKCPYCDFYSMRADKSTFDSYTDAVIRQMHSWVKRYPYQAETLYLGGGTPSLIGAENIAKIVSAAKQLFGTNGEITVECNPSAIEDGFFEMIAASGVNRISLGLQSAVDSERRILGRRSGNETIIKRIEQARTAGIDNISLDVMLGVPNQTEESLKETVDFCLDCNIPHISAYMLKLEEGTYYYKNADRLNLPDDDRVADMYLLLCDMLNESGFCHYEISNFAKPGFESQHNLKYWNCEEYLGIGPSAHSFLDGKRFYYPRDLNSFLSGTDVISDGFGGDKSEYIMLRLRLKDGLDFKEYKERFSEKIPNDFIVRAGQFARLGLMKVDENGASITEKGFLVSNYIICELELNLL